MAMPTNVTDKLEHQLLLYCARISLGSAEVVALERLLSQPLDWNYLTRQATIHGLIPLLYQHLGAFAEAVPAPVLMRLKHAATVSAKRNLRLSSELQRLLRLCATKGITALTYKGPEMAQRVYGNLALRSCLDLDILVRRADLPAVCRLLLEEGYKNDQLPGLRKPAWFISTYNEVNFTAPDQLMNIDLHWELVSPLLAFDLRVDDLWARRRPSVLASDIYTLSLEDLVLALCSHGTKDEWARLEWVCCLAELLRTGEQENTIDWAELVHRAEALGCKRLLMLGLTLARDLSAYPSGRRALSEAIGAKLTDPVVEPLCAQYWEAMFQEKVEPRTMGISVLLNIVSVCLRTRERLSDRLRARWRFCWRSIAPQPQDVALVSLPDALLPLYFIVRAGRLGVKYGLRLLRSGLHPFRSHKGSR